MNLKKPSIVFLMLLLAPFCKPVGLDSWPIVNTVFQIWKLGALAFLAIAVLPKSLGDRVRTRSVIQGTIVIFWIIYFLGCVRAGADVVTVATAAASCVLLLVFISYETRNGNGLRLLQAMAYLFSMFIIAHILSVIVAKAGLVTFSDAPNVYLFGYDNYSAFFLYPMLAVVLFYRTLRRGKLGWAGWGLMLAVVLGYLYTSSVTAAFAGIVMIGLCLIRKYWPMLRRLMDAKWVLAIMAVLLVLICAFSIQNLLASMLNAMDKGVTLNSRTYIWECALRLIGQRPIFGHGSFTAAQINSFILYGTTHAHNLLLEILMRTGIVGGAAYIAFLCGFVLRRDRRLLLRSEAGILVIGLVAQLILSFMDFYPNITVFYIFMGVLYNWDRFLREKPRGSILNRKERDLPDAEH